MREGNKTQGDKCALAVKKYGHKKESVSQQKVMRIFIFIKIRYAFEKRKSCPL